MGWYGWAFLAAWLLGAAWAFASATRDLGASVALASALSTTALLLWRPPRRSDGTWFLLVMIGRETLSIQPREPWALLGFGLGLCLLGLLLHAIYLRVERRLLALRATEGSTP
jgi:hypothetical protein